MNLTAEQLSQAVAETASIVRAGLAETPAAGIILGSGLSSLADHIAVEASWDYADLPHFARSTAHGHRGRLLAGKLGGVPVLAMAGRFHAYEGYSFQQITFPVRLMAALGMRLLIASNASGGLNPSLNPGDLLLIDDHISFINLPASQFFPPLPKGGPGGVTGIATDSPTPPSPPFVRGGNKSNYARELFALTEQIAARQNIALRRGTYIAMLGPTYETRAESLWLRTIGDVVGMSTVPEVMLAAELGVPAIAFSLVTNVYRPNVVTATTHAEVLAAASAAEPRLRQLVTGLLEAWHRG